ncbi:MAG: hypothetical protein ABIH23_16240 [bacterium]
MLRIVLLVLFLPAISTCAWGQAQETSGRPWIEFTHIPGLGEFDDLEGTVGNIEPRNSHIAVYILVNDLWWTKPTFTNSAVPINDDGTWAADITTGGRDEFATEIAAFLLPSVVVPPNASGTEYLPDIPESLAFIRFSRDLNSRIISFAGYEWTLKNSNSPSGPGPNVFSDRLDDVWVDNQGVHLTVNKREGRWWCTEVVLTKSFGYGTYIFQTSSRVDTLDPMIIAGIFSWESDAPDSKRREFDIEFGRWGDPESNSNIRYVVQPCAQCSDEAACCHRFQIELTDQENDLTHMIRWEQNALGFKTYLGEFLDTTPPDTRLIEEWRFTGDPVPSPGRETIRFNFWLYKGNPPATDRNAEFIVSGFRFSPLSGIEDWEIH